MALFAYTGMDFLLGNLRVVLGVIVLFSVFIILALFLINRYKEVLFQKLLGIDSTDLGDLESHATGLIKDISTNNIDEASQKATHIGKKVFAWYSWKMYRQYVLQVIQAIFVVFGGIIGSYLLFVQNEKIEAQNVRLDQQTYLQEAERRSSLVFLFSNIMDAIDRELTTDVEKKGVRDLTPQLIGRIVSLSQRLKPYRYMNGDTLIYKPLSPERGQLLVNLIGSQLNLNTYSQIYEKADFSYADLIQAKFDSAVYLANVNLSHADLSKCYLKNANLERVDLSYSSLSEADLKSVNLKNAKAYFANLDRADLSDSKLDNANFNQATFKSAFLNNISLVNTFLYNVDLSYTQFFNVKFENTKLSSANLFGAMVTKGTLKNQGIFDLKEISEKYIETMSTAVEGHTDSVSILKYKPK